MMYFVETGMCPDTSANFFPVAVFRNGVFWAWPNGSSDLRMADPVQPAVKTKQIQAFDCVHLIVARLDIAFRIPDCLYSTLTRLQLRKAVQALDTEFQTALSTLSTGQLWQ